MIYILAIFRLKMQNFPQLMIHFLVLYNLSYLFRPVFGQNRDSFFNILELKRNLMGIMF